MGKEEKNRKVKNKEGDIQRGRMGGREIGMKSWKMIKWNGERKREKIKRER